MPNQRPRTLACTLATADYHERVAWIADLNTAALRGYRRDDTRIELRYDASAAGWVRELVRRERQCCPFLDLTVRDRGDAVILVIEAPSDADILGVSVSGRLSRADYRDVLAPRIQLLPAQFRTLKVLFLMDGGFSGWSLGAASSGHSV